MAENRKNKEKLLEEVQNKINEKKILETERAKTDILISEKSFQVQNVKKSIAQIDDEISKIKKVSFNQEEVNSLIQRILFQESKEKELQKEYIEVITKINADEYKKSELQMLKNKIIGLDKCPTCLQEVVEEYKKNIMNNAEREFEIINKNIDSNKGKKKELISKMEEVKKALENFKSSKSSLEMLKIRIENIKDKEKTRDEYEKQKSIIEKNIMLLKTMKENLDKLIKELDIFEIIFKERSQEVQKAKEEENKVMIKKAETNKEIEYLDKDIHEKTEVIKQKENIKKQNEKLKELEFWITEKFLDIVLFTEKQVMMTLKEEFSRLFSKWFSILVSDTLTARLNDNFSPVIEQQDYEIDYSFLSGGERTAIALAYRLSLNQVLNSMLSNIKTSKIVILDEPTDGFSYQQLDKMRDVLAQLDVEQLIIVSHEPKIESFVDNIIKIKKENGISSIENKFSEIINM